MTRGRHANHLYLATDTPHPDCAHRHDPHSPTADPRETLTAILARSGAATSATHAITDAADAATALTRLTAIRDTLQTDAARPGPIAGRETPTDVTGPSVEPTSPSEVAVTIDTALTAIRGLIRDRITRRPGRSSATPTPWPPATPTPSHPGTQPRAASPQPPTPSTVLHHRNENNPTVITR